jgi:hypothetical protein
MGKSQAVALEKPVLKLFPDPRKKIARALCEGQPFPTTLLLGPEVV